MASRGNFFSRGRRPAFLSDGFFPGLSAGPVCQVNRPSRPLLFAVPPRHANFFTAPTPVSGTPGRFFFLHRVRFLLRKTFVLSAPDPPSPFGHCRTVYSTVLPPPGGPGQVLSGPTNRSLHFAGYLFFFLFLQRTLCFSPPNGFVSCSRFIAAFLLVRVMGIAFFFWPDTPVKGSSCDNLFRTQRVPLSSFFRSDTEGLP